MNEDQYLCDHQFDGGIECKFCGATVAQVLLESKRLLDSVENSLLNLQSDIEGQKKKQ